MARLLLICALLIAQLTLAQQDYSYQYLTDSRELRSSGGRGGGGRSGGSRGGSRSSGGYVNSAYVYYNGRSDAGFLAFGYHAYREQYSYAYYGQNSNQTTCFLEDKECMSDARARIKRCWIVYGVCGGIVALCVFTAFVRACYLKYCKKSSSERKKEYTMDDVEVKQEPVGFQSEEKGIVEGRALDGPDQVVNFSMGKVQTMEMQQNQNYAMQQPGQEAPVEFQGQFPPQAPPQYYNDPSQQQQPAYQPQQYGQPQYQYDQPQQAQQQPQYCQDQNAYPPQQQQQQQQQPQYYPDQNAYPPQQQQQQWQQPQYYQDQNAYPPQQQQQQWQQPANQGYADQGADQNQN